MSEKKPDVVSGIGRKLVMRFAAFMLLLPAVLFIAVGRLDWMMGWIYVGMLFVFTAISRIIVIRTNPELIVERSKFTEGEGVKEWDKVIAPLIALVGSLAILIVAGLDVRFGWSSQIPLVLQVVSMVFVGLGYVVATWAMVTNKFFSGVVRIQKDRGHTVATGGPYKYVRHPSYAGGICLNSSHRWP